MKDDKISMTVVLQKNDRKLLKKLVLDLVLHPINK